MKSTDTQYHGVRLHSGAHVTVATPGREKLRTLEPDASFALQRSKLPALGWGDSPVEYSWGFGGIGASQLALAILLDWTESEVTSLALFQDFKWGVIASIREPSFHLAGGQIREWLMSKDAHLLLPELVDTSSVTINTRDCEPMDAEASAAIQEAAGKLRAAHAKTPEAT